MRPNDFACRALILLSLVTVLCRLASAQTSYDTSPDAQTGRQQYGSYFDAGIDSVNFKNGNLNLNIPLFTLPGRELSVAVVLSYNNQQWEEDDCDGYECGRYTGGWRLESPFGSGLSKFLSCASQYVPGSGYQYIWTMDAYWTDPLGTKHRFSENVTASCGGPWPSWDNRTFKSMDGDGSVLTTNIATGVSRLTFKDGTARYFRTSGHDPNVYYYDLRTTSGNYLVAGPNGLPTQDTLGRTIDYEFVDGPFNTYSKRYKVRDANGVLQTYELNYFQKTVYDPYLEDEAEDDLDLISSILLPNGKSYQFEYDHQQGFMTKVILPSGAYIRYVYPTNQLSEHNDYVTGRYESADGTAGSEKHWQYSSSIHSSVGTVTSPDGEVTVHKFDTTGTEYETEFQGGTGAIVKKVLTSWQVDGVASNGQPDKPKRQIMTTVSYPDMLAFRKTVAYDADGYVTSDKVSDWFTFATGVDEGPVISEKLFTYTAFNPIKRIASETLKGIDPVSGSFTTQGTTEYVYDEYPLTNQTGVPNHTGNSSPSGRGNLTTVKRYKDATNYVADHLKYDSVGNAVEQIDPLNHSTLLDWTDNFTDGLNRNTFAYLKKTTNPLSQYTTSKYDFNTGLVKEVTNLRGYTTTTTYDLLNRVTSVTEANGKQTTYAYDDTNRITTKEVTVDASGNKGRVKTYFDGLYRVVQTRTNDPEGEIYVDVEYDGKGRKKRVTNPYRSGGAQLWTTNNYDGTDRVTAVTATDGSVVSHAYKGNQTMVTDEAGNARRYTYNPLGKMIQVEEPNPTLDTPLSTTYKYYVFGPLYRSDQGGQLRTFTHDWLGQMLTQQLPESGTTSFVYDADGRLTSKTDARSITTTFSYDNANRSTGKTYSDSTPSVAFGYDASGMTGLRTSMTDGLGSVTYSYDNMDRLTQEQRTLTGISGTFTTAYAFNIKGDLTQMTYPSGRVVDFNYATGGGCCNSRLDTVVDQATSTTIASNHSYNAAGETLSRTLGNGLVESFGYNDRFQLTNVTAVQASTTLMNFTYNYGTSAQNTGRVLSRTDVIQSEHSVDYRYDSIYRLSQAVSASDEWGIGWAFDIWGNRVTQTPQGLATGKVGTLTMGYLNNRLITYTYDTAGNQTNDGLHNYTFNAENQIKQVDGGGAATYGYDGEGLRMKKTVGSETTYYFYGVGGLLCEFTTANTGATQAAATDRTAVLTSDRLGSAVLLVSLSGAVLENNRTLPYGELWLQEAASSNDKKFTTYQRDQESNLDYAMNRYVSNSNGRFQSPDQGRMALFLPTSLNRYTYVGADPINKTDETGNEWECTELFGGYWSSGENQYWVEGITSCNDFEMPEPPISNGESGGSNAMDFIMLGEEAAAQVTSLINVRSPDHLQYRQVQSRIKNLIAALREDTKCADTLSGPLGSALDKLEHMANNFTVADALDSGGSVVRVGAYVPEGTNPGVVVNGAVYFDRDFTIPGAPGITTTSNAGRNVILLHELGHLTGRNLSDGGGSIRAGVYGASNTARVMENCAKTVSTVTH